MASHQFAENCTLCSWGFFGHLTDLVQWSVPFILYILSEWVSVVWNHVNWSPISPWTEFKKKKGISLSLISESGHAGHKCESLAWNPFGHHRIMPVWIKSRVLHTQQSKRSRFCFLSNGIFMCPILHHVKNQDGNVNESQYVMCAKWKSTHIQEGKNPIHPPHW